MVSELALPVYLLYLGLDYVYSLGRGKCGFIGWGQRCGPIPFGTMRALDGTGTPYYKEYNGRM